MSADLIAQFRARLDERERLAREALREEPAMADLPFQALLGVVAARNLLDLLAAAYRRRAAVEDRAYWTESTAPACPEPLPDGPGEEMLPGLELAIQTLAAQFDDPAPAVRRMLEAMADAWERGDPAPGPHERVLTDHIWYGYEATVGIASAPELTPAQQLFRPHGGLKITFRAALLNGATVSTSERRGS